MLRPLLLALALSAGTAQAATPADGMTSAPPELTQDQMAEVVDFVVGNAVFTLLHQAGHMMMERYGVDGAGGEKGADEFALQLLIAPRSGAGDQTLIDTVDSWLLSYNQTASTDSHEVVLPDRHAVDAGRARAIVCNMVGDAPEDFSDVADAASLTPEARAGCVLSYRDMAARWQKALAPFAPKAGAAPMTVAVHYDAPTGGPTAESTMLQDNKVLEEVASRLSKAITLPEPPSLRAKSCDSVTASYDAARNEIVLCYEMSAYHSDLILRDIEDR